MGGKLGRKPGGYNDLNQSEPAGEEGRLFGRMNWL